MMSKPSFLKKKSLFKLIGIFLFSPSFALGLTMDWSGFTRGEFHLQKSNGNMYGEYHLVLQPKIQVIDRLSIVGSLELFPSYSQDLFLESLSSKRRVGVLFFHRPSLSGLDVSSLLLNVTQFYVNYESEFFRFRFGRAPYHFGLGITYNDGQDPSHYWFSVFNQLALYLEYSHFYFQPVLIQDQDKLVALVQAGIQSSQWKLEGFYRYDRTTTRYVELYGEYLWKNWDAKASVSYDFSNELSLGVAFEGGIKIATAIPSRLKVKAGVAQNFSFHPNYEVAFLLWNHLIERANEQATQKVLLQDISVSNLVYFNPFWEFALVKKTFDLTPSVTLGYELEERKTSYELDLKGRYLFSKNFSVSVTGGLLYKDKKSNYGVLGQAAVTF